MKMFQADNGAVISQPDFTIVEIVKFGKKNKFKPISDYIGKEIWADIENDMNDSNGTAIYGYEINVTIKRIEKDPYL